MTRIVLRNPSPFYTYTNEIKIGHSADSCDPSLQRLANVTLGPHQEAVIATVSQTTDVFWKSLTCPYWTHSTAWDFDDRHDITMDTCEGQSQVDICSMKGKGFVQSPFQSSAEAFATELERARQAIVAEVREDASDNNYYLLLLDSDGQTVYRIEKKFVQVGAQPLEAKFGDGKLRTLNAVEIQVPAPATAIRACSTSDIVSNTSNVLKQNHRVLVYNKTGQVLEATLSSHPGRQTLPIRRDWAQWRVIDDNETFILRIFIGSSSTPVYSLDVSIAVAYRDRHITIYERASGFYHRMEEPW